MSKIILTGGCGYIGSHTAVELINNGYEVVLIDNLSNSKIDVLQGIKRITGVMPICEKVELTNWQATSEVFEKHKNASAVIHFAAFKAVGESIAFPMKYYENNIKSMLNTVHAAVKSMEQCNFVFSSSCTVYGTPTKLPLTEQMPLSEPTSPYGKTKLLGEYMLNDLTRQYDNLKVISLRYFNPIGAHKSIEIGESPLKTYNLIPILTEVAVGKRKYIEIFGDDYPTKDGTPVRDYIYVSDVAQAHFVALERLRKKQNKNSYEFFNIGLGKGYSVLEVIKTFEEISGKKINYKISSRREGDVAEIYASTDLMYRETGWRATTELEEMLRTAWLWELNKKF